MNRIRTLLIAGAFAGATAVAYAATPRLHVFDPPTIEQMGLSGAAAAQWNGLREQTLHLRDSARTTAEHESGQLHQLLSSSAPDLDAFNRKVEQEVDDYLAQARALKAQKLAFYASLSPAQQKQARSIMLDRFERIERLRAAFADLSGATP